VTPIYRTVVTEKHGTFNTVLQFTYVARPVIRHQHIDRRCTDPPDLLVILHHVAIHEKVGQLDDIVPAIAQRRNDYWEHVDPIIEITANGARLHCRLKVTMGGGNEANICFARLVAADPLIGPFLKHSQQANLDRRRHITDFIKKERPTRYRTARRCRSGILWATSIRSS